MSEREAEAQVRLRGVVEELMGIRLRLQEIARGLPASPQEAVMLVGEEEPDVATEVRSIIECVLADQIGPAVRDLGAAAEYRPKGQGRER
ncbi:MAG TPA: hypothetical protein VGG03_26480 [Thermoanaerobaculia bacterium]